MVRSEIRKLFQRLSTRIILLPQGLQRRSGIIRQCAVKRKDMAGIELVMLFCSR